MKAVFEIVQQLEEIRKVPQFIFIAPIIPPSTHQVRVSVSEYKKANPDVNEIDFILESPGGLADDAYRIIRTLRANFEIVNIVIPWWAKSAATLLALGGSKIIMDEFGEFGPLDAQIEEERDDELSGPKIESALIDEYSLTRIEKRAQELYRSMLMEILENKELRFKRSNLSNQLLTYVSLLYKPLLEKLNPYDIGAKARSLAVGEKYAGRILAQFNNDNMKSTIEYFVDYIVHDCPDHGYIIDYSVISIFLKNVCKSAEFGEDYEHTLSKLSHAFFAEPKKPYSVGFFKKELIDKEVKVIDTKNELRKKKRGKKK